MMHSFTKTISAACFILSAIAQQCFANETVGVREMTLASPQRGRELAATVWYPASEGGSRQVLGETALFIGTPAMRDAPMADGRYPVILLSHGAGIAGTPAGVSWLAAPLAQHGFIVAAPTHPGNGGPDKSAAETMKLWLRPGDISATLDAIGRTAFFGPHIVPEKVGMLGLSMGGSTALALAGARFDADRLAGYCDTDASNHSLCQWVRMSGVDLHAVDMGQAGESRKDPRIHFIMAVDPAPMDVLRPDSFPEIDGPIAILNLGRVADLPPTVRADSAARLMRHASYSVIEDASHFSMFAECKPVAAETVLAEIGEPICSDGEGRSRKEIHKQIINTVMQAFDQMLRRAR